MPSSDSIRIDGGVVSGRAIEELANTVMSRHGVGRDMVSIICRHGHLKGVVSILGIDVYHCESVPEGMLYILPNVDV